MRRVRASRSGEAWSGSFGRRTAGRGISCGGDRAGPGRRGARGVNPAGRQIRGTLPRRRQCARPGPPGLAVDVGPADPRARSPASSSAAGRCCAAPGGQLDVEPHQAGSRSEAGRPRPARSRPGAGFSKPRPERTPPRPAGGRAAGVRDPAGEIDGPRRPRRAAPPRSSNLRQPAADSTGGLRPPRASRAELSWPPPPRPRFARRAAGQVAGRPRPAPADICSVNPGRHVERRLSTVADQPGQPGVGP